MRSCAVLMLALSPVLALAQQASKESGTALGTKPDVVQTAQGGASSMSLMPLLQMALAVGVILLLLKVLLPKLMSKFNKGLKGNLSGGIRVEEAATFAGGTLNVVSARGKTLLLCAGAQGVTFLADLTEPPAASEPKTFSELLEAAAEPPVEVGHKASTEAMGSAVVAAPTAEVDPDDIQAALNRAKLLAI